MCRSAAWPTGADTTRPTGLVRTAARRRRIRTSRRSGRSCTTTVSCGSLRATRARQPDAYLWVPIVEARTWDEKSATNNGTRQWTYTLEPEDTELYLEINIPKGGTNGYYSRVVPRATIGTTSRVVIIDSRVPGVVTGHPDSASAGVTASISGNTLTLSTVGFAPSDTQVSSQGEVAQTPVVYSK